MKILITIFALLISQFSCSQEISSPIQTIVDEIAKDNMKQSKGVGYPDKGNSHWDRFEALKTNATAEELILLTNHKNTSVKCFSFQALAERKHPKTFELLVDHLKDEDVIGTFQGCALGSLLVGDYFFYLVTSNHITFNAYKLNENQHHQLDSILLFDKEIKLTAKDDLLGRIEPKESYYKRIKEIYENEKSKNSVLALSKYQKEKDVEIIKERLENESIHDQVCGLKAVLNFAHPDFFPSLKKMHKKEIQQAGSHSSLTMMMYLAIVQYKDMESRALMELALDLEEKPKMYEHPINIWIALSKYPDPVYNGLKESIQLSKLQRGMAETTLQMLEDF